MVRIIRLIMRMFFGIAESRAGPVSERSRFNIQTGGFKGSTYLESDFLDVSEMILERATRAAAAISWWKTQGVLARSRWPRRSAQAST